MTTTRNFFTKAHNSLVDKAKSVPVKRRRSNQITVEHLELAIAWMTDQVTISQVAQVLDTSNGNAHARMATWLHEAYRQGLIEVVKK